MRRLRIIEHISLDGVTQHASDGDDFPCSDWQVPRCRIGSLRVSVLVPITPEC